MDPRIQIDFNADLDPAFYLIADPDPDPGNKPMPINADPDPDPGHIEVEFLHEKYTWSLSNKKKN